MIRRFALLIALAVVVAALPRPSAGQVGELATLLPDADEAAQWSRVIVGVVERNLHEVVATFANPAAAAHNLAAWGWEGNVVQELAPSDPATLPVAPLQVSVYRFATPEGAARAMRYFAAARAAALGLERHGLPPIGDEALEISRGLDFDSERSVYVRAGRVVVRATAQPGSGQSAAEAAARSVARKVRGEGRYVSPRFGYGIAWDGAVWSVAEERSIPGVGDDLALVAGPLTLSWSGRFVALPEPGSPDRPDALGRYLRTYAAGRAALHPGATVRFNEPYATIAFPADGELREETVYVVPLLANEGVVLRTLGHPAEWTWVWVGERIYGLWEEDWAAAADDEPAGLPPGGLDALAGSDLSADRATAAVPPGFGRFGVVESGADDFHPLWGNLTATRYADARDASDRATAWIIPLQSDRDSTGSLRILLQHGTHGVLAHDLRHDAPVPFVLRENHSPGGATTHELYWGVRGSDWLVRVEAPTLADVEAFAETWLAGTEATPGA